MQTTEVRLRSYHAPLGQSAFAAIGLQLALERKRDVHDWLKVPLWEAWPQASSQSVDPGKRRSRKPHGRVVVSLCRK